MGVGNDAGEVEEGDQHQDQAGRDAPAAVADEPPVLDQIVERKYDLYLLCNTDLPWIDDELREYPDLHTRKKLYAIYKDLMINQAVPWVDISGSYEQRLQKAISAVDALLK